MNYFFARHRRGIFLFGIFFGMVLLNFPVGAAEEAARTASPFYRSICSLLPPVIAIALALLTKQVYLSLFTGVVVGALFAGAFHPGQTLTVLFQKGLVGSIADPYNAGILVFLVILGILVALMNRAGGSAAFGRWASQHIKSRVGAQLVTTALGVFIFIDDYFNCLTVGSVMRPLTDRYRISRAKLAYLIDATAAPVCIIAPVSSWAAAVSSYVGEGKGISLFIQTIPFNFYALLTLVMMVILAVTGWNYGPMAQAEEAADRGADLSRLKAMAESQPSPSSSGRVIDLVLPIVVLIGCCIAGMLYSGGFFAGSSFVVAFSQSDASIGLVIGSSLALVFTILYYLFRRLIPLKEVGDAIPQGFQSMVPAILILVLAWSLKSMTDGLGAGAFVQSLVARHASAFHAFLPALIFLIGGFLSFSTGTSWGTFGILIPITLGIFPLSNPLGVVCVSACMAGAVCGDHCSPISDTTIMAGAGAQCDHLSHVSTQLPYAMTIAGVSFIAYLLTGFFPHALPILLFSILLLLGSLWFFSQRFPRKERH